MNAPFIIMGLPRSRTAWMTAWMYTERSAILHEPLASCDSIDELAGKLSVFREPNVGIADTSAALLVEQIYRRWPKARFITIERDPDEVGRSLRALGFNTKSLDVLKTAFTDAIAFLEHEEANLLRVQYNDLQKLDTLVNVWTFALPLLPFNARRTVALNDMIVTCDLGALMARSDVTKGKTLLGLG